MNLTFEKTWRWYGPDDPISLQDTKQAGVTGIVTALHHISNGEIWTVSEINKRKKAIEEAGLTWSVVESVPVHESIKTQTGNFKTHIENYKQTLINLGKCGIDTVCYNFMPLLDWTRTDIEYPSEDGSTTLKFDKIAFATFELFLLKRSEAKKDYTEGELVAAEEFYKHLNHREKEKLINNIIAGLPGSEEGYSLEEFNENLATYRYINAEKLKQHLFYFLRNIIPTAENENISMCIHPDDPPYSILKLPRVVSTERDIVDIYNAVNSLNNGLTFCSGSFGINPYNELKGMIKRLGERIHFIHLRSVKRCKDGSFYEANHLEGDVDMYGVMRALINEQEKRQSANRPDLRMPIRPDHGHKMLEDLKKKTNPGYSAIGRLRGLAELRGLEMGIRKSLFS